MRHGREWLERARDNLTLRGGVALAIFLLVPGLLLGNAFHSWTWFFATPVAEVFLLYLIGALGPETKRNVTPQELADELERHLIGNEGPHDWEAVTSVEIADARLNRLIPRFVEYDRIDTAEKREEFREIVEALRRGEFPE